jgi:hypothetical protein
MNTLLCLLFALLVGLCSAEVISIHSDTDFHTILGAVSPQTTDLHITGDIMTAVLSAGQHRVFELPFTPTISVCSLELPPRIKHFELDHVELRADNCDDNMQVRFAESRTTSQQGHAGIL